MSHDGATLQHDDGSHEGLPAVQTLKRVLEARTPQDSTRTDVLREAICDFVRELKGRELPPERVLVIVKGVVSAARLDDDWDAQRRLLQQVITWCIDEYYRPR